MQFGVGGLRVAAAGTVRGGGRIPHWRAGAHRGEARRTHLGVPAIAFRAPDCGLLGTVGLLLRGRCQKLASARGMNAHAGQDGPLPPASTPCFPATLTDASRRKVMIEFDDVDAALDVVRRPAPDIYGPLLPPEMFSNADRGVVTCEDPTAALDDQVQMRVHTRYGSSQRS